MADGKVEYEVRVDTQGVSKDLDDAEKKIKKASQKGEDSVKKSTNNVEKEIKKATKSVSSDIDASAGSVDSFAKILGSINGSSFSDVEDKIKGADKELDSILESISKAPKETKLFAQAFDVLSANISATKDKLKILENAQEDVEKAFKSGNLSAEQYREYQREVIDTASSLKELEKQAKGGEKGLSDLAKEADGSTGIFGKLKGVVEGLGVSMGSLSVAAVGIKAISGAADLDKAMGQFAAATGIADEELSKYEESLKNIYTGGYGESFEDIGNAMATITQQMGKLDQATLQNITEGVYAFSDVFKSDVGETLRGVNQLMTQFGITAEDALDLMATGSQKGLDYTSELGDNIAEYAGKFSQAGYSAEEYFQLLKNGSEGGSYSLDKVNDAINEVTNKLADGSIKESIGIFSGETKKLFESWQKGGASQKQVIDSIVKDINNCTNEQEALTMAATAFGTMGEDANLDFIKSLTSVGNEFDNVKGKVESIKTDKYDNLGSMLEELQRSFELLLIPIGEAFIPLLSAVVELLTPIADVIGGTLSPVLEQLSEVILLLSEPLEALIEFLGQVLGIAMQLLSEALTPILDVLIQILEPITQLLNEIFEPIMEMLTAIMEPLSALINAALQPILTLITSLIEPLTSLVEMILPILQDLFAELTPIITSVFDALTPLFNIFTEIAEFISGILGPVIEKLAGILAGVLGGAIDAIMPIIEGLVSVFSSVVDFLVNVFSGNWEAAWDGIVNIFRNIFNLIPTIIESIINGAIGIINGLIQGVNSLIGWLGIGEIPLIAKVKLPRFHTGGIVDFEEGEGLAMLKKGEMVLTQQQQAELFAIANGAAPRGEAMGSDRPLYADITLTGNVEMDGLKVGRVFLRNLDDAAAFTLRG